MQDGRKAAWSTSTRFCGIFPSLKQYFIAYRSSKVSSRPDCVFEIHQLWQSGFSRVYSNCYCSCWFEPEIIKIGQSSHKMYTNNIMNFQESTSLNACAKKSGNLLKAPCTFTSKPQILAQMKMDHRIKPCIDFLLSVTEILNKFTQAYGDFFFFSENSQLWPGMGVLVTELHLWAEQICFEIVCFRYK